MEPLVPYSTRQLFEIVGESQRNMDNARHCIHLCQFDLAAAQLEVAASKLRMVQNQLDETLPTTKGVKK